MGDRDHVGSTEHVALWDAIDAVVVASGGKANTSVARMRAVVRVEDSLRRLMATKPDPRDARIAELEQRVLAWEPVVRAAVAFCKAPAYSEDASAACQTLEDAVGALPVTSIPK